MDRNPYASPNAAVGPHMLPSVPIEAVPADPPLGVIDVVEPAGTPPRTWRLAFAEDTAWLYVPTEGTAFELRHADIAEHGSILVWGGFVALALRGLLSEGRAISFKVEGPRIAPFRAWVLRERELILGAAFTRGARFNLGIGLFVALTSFPLFGDRFDPFGFVFGAGLALVSFVGPRRPRAWLFAIEALVWLSLAASTVMKAIDGSKISIAFAILGVLIGRQSVLKLRFYR